MFLLTAELVLVSGVADDLFRAAAAWIGRVPGGLGMATAVCTENLNPDVMVVKPAEYRV
jgi:TRAP-type C4-dicarboxylate transport system permease large subunit